ncbi:MAG: OmpA family protein, partial [Pseudomonadales bacterium]
MIKLQSLSVILLALVLAGCASTATEEPVEPVTDTVDEVKVTPPEPVVAPQEYNAFDEDLNPRMPGTNRLLPRTYYFEFDSAIISQDDLASLEMHATILRNNRDRSVVIEGHCDERGTREYNLALGERRADTIRSYLTSAGVSPRQIEMVSYG